MHTHVPQPRKDQVCGHREGNACGSSAARVYSHVPQPCDQLLLEQWGRDHAETTTITE